MGAKNRKSELVAPWTDWRPQDHPRLRWITITLFVAWIGFLWIIGR